MRTCWRNRHGWRLGALALGVIAISGQSLASAADAQFWAADLNSAESWAETENYRDQLELRFGGADASGTLALTIAGLATNRTDAAWRIRTKRIDWAPPGKYTFAVDLEASEPVWKVVDGGIWISSVKWFDRAGRQLARHRIPLQFPRQKQRMSLTETVPAGAASFEIQLGALAPYLMKGDWLRLSAISMSAQPADAACGCVIPDVRPPQVRIVDSEPSTDVRRPLRIAVTDPSGIDWATARVLLDGTEATAQFARRGDELVIERPSRDWTQGVHHVDVHVADQLGNVADARKIFLIGTAPATTRTTLRDDGVILVDGKPHFPIGIYGVNRHTFNAYSFDRAVSDLKDAGFNTLQSYHSDRLPGFLAAVSRHGMRMWTDARKLNGDFVSRIRFNSDVIAWYVGDDTFDNTTPEQLQDRVDNARALDPSRVTAQADPVWSYSTVDRYWHYAAVADVFLPEIYPVRGKSEKDDRQCVASVIRDMRCILRNQRERGGGRPHAVWPIIQEFYGWSSWSRFPTEAEFRGMCFAALVHGAKGLTLYTYGTTLVPEKKIFNYGVTATEDVWRATTNLTRQVASLVPVLLERDVAQPPVPQVLSGPARDAMDEGPSVTALLKCHDGWTYLLAVNAADAEVKARFETRVEGSIEVLWENRALTAASGGFEDVFAPLGVHVYRFRKQQGE